MSGEAGLTTRGLTIPGLLRRNAVDHGAKVVLVTEERSVTHAELDDLTRSLARGLVGAGVGKGARVGILLPNGIDWAVTALAVARVGGVLVPLSTLLRPPELAAQLDVAGVTHLVVAEAFRGRDYHADLESIAPGLAHELSAGRRHAEWGAGGRHAEWGAGGRHAALPNLRAVWTVAELPEPSVPEALVDALADAVRPADDLAILFTSGSRGAPKGTIHTHGSGLRAVAASLDARQVGPDDRLYIPMPFFWTGGFSMGLLSVIVAGATLITEAVPEPERTLDLLERERVTLFRGWPDQAARLAAHPRFAGADLSSLRPASLAPVLPPEQRPEPGARANLFGMTETFGPWCGDRLDVDLPPDARGSCGRPFAGIEVRIVSPETGERCPVGESGEIRLRGPNLMRGVCGRTRDQVFDTDGFYPTGDLGSIDAAGYLWYHGRLDDMFKVRGATVYPAEVEAALRSIPGVQQAHVTDVSGDDGGHEVGALVITVLGQAEVAAAAKERLSSFKLPTRWVVTSSADAVPLLATAKVDKPALQLLLRHQSSA